MSRIDGNLIRLRHDPRNEHNFTDEEGCVWTKFEIDYLAMQTPGTCCECGDEILDAGFLCLDGGDEVCRDCVSVLDEAGVSQTS